MENTTTDQMDKNKLCVQKMNFMISNRRPKIQTKNLDAAKKEIEKQLFLIFEKYADHG